MRHLDHRDTALLERLLRQQRHHDQGGHCSILLASIVCGWLVVALVARALYRLWEVAHA